MEDVSYEDGSGAGGGERQRGRIPADEAAIGRGACGEARFVQRAFDAERRRAGSTRQVKEVCPLAASEFDQGGRQILDEMSHETAFALRYAGQRCLPIELSDIGLGEMGVLPFEKDFGFLHDQSR